VEEEEEVEWILSKIGRIESRVRTKSRNSSGGRVFPGKEVDYRGFESHSAQLFYRSKKLENFPHS
jgi:hypothetical protein